MSNGNENEFDPITVPELDPLPTDLLETDLITVTRDGDTFKGTGKQLADSLISSLISENPGEVFRDSLKVFNARGGIDFNSPPLESGWFGLVSGGSSNPPIPGFGRAILEQYWYKASSVGALSGVQRVTRTEYNQVFQRSWHSGEPTPWREVHMT